MIQIHEAQWDQGTVSVAMSQSLLHPAWNKPRHRSEAQKHWTKGCGSKGMIFMGGCTKNVVPMGTEQQL